MRICTARIGKAFLDEHYIVFIEKLFILMDSMFNRLRFYKSDFYEVLISYYEHSKSQLGRVGLSDSYRLDKYTRRTSYTLEVDKKCAQIVHIIEHFSVLVAALSLNTVIADIC